MPREACWCGETRAARVTVLRAEGFARGFPVVRCVRCATERLAPMPAGDILARAYATEYYGAGEGRKFVGPVASLTRLFQGGRAELVAATVRPKRRFRPRLLDVGCGNGNFLRQARACGFAVEGTELSEASARRASPDGDLEIHVGDLTRLHLPEARYNAVSMWHVLEHVPDPGATLAEVHRILAPGGWLFLSLPNVDSWQAQATGRHWFHRDPPRHLWHFSPRTLGRLLRARGFTVQRCSHWSWEQNPFGWLQSLLNQWGFPPNEFYELLKGQVPLRRVGLRQLAAAMVAGVAAVPLSVAESLAGAGGTITLEARRRSPGVQ